MGFNKTWVKKNRTINGGRFILEQLKNYTEEALIINGYVETDNPHAKKILSMYEQMLLMGKCEPKNYLEKRHELHLQMADYIHKHQLYTEWSDLIYFLNKNMSVEMLSLYKSEAMETWSYLTGLDEKDVYGVTRDNQLLIAPSFYGDWDMPSQKQQYLFEKGKISRKKLIKYIKENEVRIKTTESNESISNIAVMELIPFINERTKEIYCQHWLPHAQLEKMQLPRKWKETGFYEEQLSKRKYVLDRKGVNIRLKNAGTIENMLFIEDVAKDNQPVLLYRIDTVHGSSMGYYHLGDKFFFSPWKYSNSMETHEQIENFILEVYTELTCGLEKDRRRFYALQVVEDVNYLKSFRETNVYAQFELNETKKESEREANHKKGISQRPHERRFTLRKLKEGQSASEEAKQMALEFGIELQDGYTFVRSYKVGENKPFRETI